MKESLRTSMFGSDVLTLKFDFKLRDCRTLFLLILIVYFAEERKMVLKLFSMNFV